MLPRRQDEDNSLIWPLLFKKEELKMAIVNTSEVNKWKYVGNTVTPTLIYTPIKLGVIFIKPENLFQELTQISSKR